MLVVRDFVFAIDFSLSLVKINSKSNLMIFRLPIESKKFHCLASKAVEELSEPLAAEYIVDDHRPPKAGEMIFDRKTDFKAL